MPSSNQRLTGESVRSIPHNLGPIWERLERVSAIKDREIRVARLESLRADLAELPPSESGVALLIASVESAIAKERGQDQVAIDNSPGQLVAMEGAICGKIE